MVSAIQLSNLGGQGKRFTYVFTPCNTNVSECDFMFLINAYSIRPINITVVDYEQYMELGSRIDLYGYLTRVNNSMFIHASVTYPKGIPCWPIYVVIEGEGLTFIYVLRVSDS